MEHVTHMKSQLDSTEPPFLAAMTDAVFAAAAGELPDNMISINTIVDESVYLNKSPIDDEGVSVCIDPDGLGISRTSEYYKFHADPILHIFRRITSQVSRAEEIVKEAGGNIEGGLGYADVFQKSGWTWEIIRAFLYVANEYLIQTGRTLDDLLNGKSTMK